MEENFGIGLIRRVFLSSFFVQNFISIGQAVAEIFEFVFQKRPFYQKFFFQFYILQLHVRACTRVMTLLAKMDPKYDASGSKSHMASRGDPQMTALQLKIHHQVQIATK